jgi:hypothetical protein
MKRAALAVLILCIAALPTFGAEKQKLTAPHCASLERISGGWRMVINCEEGKGAIVLLDSQKAMQYRGEGMFASWSQVHLNSVYQSLIPKADVAFEILQLG